MESLRSVVIYPEPGYEGESLFLRPAPNNWQKGNAEVMRRLKQEGYTVKVWPCEVDTQNDIGLAFDHPVYDCKIPDTALCVSLEPPVVRPRFFQRIHGWPYKRIITCHKPFVDDKYIFYSPFPTMPYDGPLAEKKTGKLVAISSGNKKFGTPGEMYTTRRNVYMGFGKHLDLYGWGWESDPEVRDACNYLGQVENKIKILSQYETAIVIENQVVPGYTSEKYWDCLQAGTKMVYIGSYPDYGIEEALPEAWANRIVSHLNTL